MNTQQLHPLLNNIEQLPIMPKVVLDIIRSIDDENCSIEQLTHQISSDAGLAANVLKIANHHRFSRHGGIASVHDAIMLVGFKQIRNLICISGLADSHRGAKNDEFDFARFWQHCVAVGVCANTISRHLIPKNNINPDLAFVAGVLHDIGILAYALAAPDQVLHIKHYQQQQHCTRCEAELAILGITHTQLGAQLAHHWALPDVLIKTIAFHHTPDQAPHNLVTDLIHLSQVVCHGLALSQDQYDRLQLSNSVLFRLNIELNQIAALFSEIECDYQAIAENV